MGSEGDRRATLIWFREDLRLADHPALSAAAAAGGPVIPVFILDDEGPGRRLGGAARWWLDKSLAALATSLRAKGSRLILRRGQAAVEIRRLIEETGAGQLVFSRSYEAAVAERDAALQRDLEAQGVAVQAFEASLLVPPGTVLTGEGRPFKVFTPFWRAARTRLDAVEALPAPRALPAPDVWPASESLSSLNLHPTTPDWSGGFSGWTPGEAGAEARLDAFVERGLNGYAARRDFPGVDGSSRLSPHLRWGEISPRQVWRAVQTAVAAGLAGERDAEAFLSEIGWREFDWQLLAAQPDLARRNVQVQFDAFPWRDDTSGFRAWTRGETGYPIVDAGMRELWTTGFMHNRVRMIAASFLTKHLMVDWRRGEAWFWDTLVDADAANNPANWQWVAGCGADAAPYFRVFNPTLQGAKFDPDGAYVRRWVPELAHVPDKLLHEPWRAALLAPGYPEPIVGHAQGRERALAAYADLRAEA
jgi:deoxyribodipyrimidine photo-lyase